MSISLRDERGQGVVEYVLVLVVSVGIVLGLLHQLNSAFKDWANNYFGNYLACLLETGELPSISGSPGDSGICNQLFKPFTLADGRKLRTDVAAARKAGAGGGNAGQRGGGGRGGGGGAIAGGGGGLFGGSGKRMASGGRRVRVGKAGPVYTGSTAVSSGAYGSGGSTPPREIRLKTTVDQKFAFDESRERQQRRQISSSAVKPTELGQRQQRIPIRDKPKKAQLDNSADGGSFTISTFIRILIIAAIIIALIMFLGGQALQIGKGMNAQ